LAAQAAEAAQAQQQQPPKKRSRGFLPWLASRLHGA